MKRLLIFALTGLIGQQCAHSQGQFVFANPTAPTRIGSIDGALAGPGIWAQMFAGQNTDSLAPVGSPREHSTNGLVFGGSLTVDGTGGWLDPNHAFVQMVAWDGTIWGTALADVPSNQLGRTDIVLTPLGYPPGPNTYPPFTLPATVPPIPEPSVLSFVIMGCAFASLRYACRKGSRASNHVRGFQTFLGAHKRT